MDLISLVLIHFGALLTPGPDLLLISAYALKTDFKHAFKAVWGIVVGVLLWTILSLFGLKLFFELFPSMRTIIALLGGSYLLYLAFMCLKSLSRPLQWQSTTPKQAFLSGFFTNLLNPKAALYFGSIFSGLDFAHTLGAWVIGVLALETLLFFSAIAYLFSKDSMRRAYTRYYKGVDLCCALLFGAFGSFLWIKTLWG
ncbi:LysE family transporter [Helicobacter vulpis]|uniref:LysE family transporter n=1 Tax=Helicobacter vulpis TaxID=2316076 RepID=UPI0013CDF2F7|nr:LysE family transporter [Helicobacter vulpis]